MRLKLSVRFFLISTATAFGVFWSITSAHGCSRVLWNNNGFGVLVGRNMDWFQDMHTKMWVLPRGMKRDGLARLNPLTWTSKYGSLVLSAYDVGTVDGMNEQGLAAHALYLPETSAAPRNENVPGMSISMWVQYYLDNFSTVHQAVEALTTYPYQLRMAVEPSTKKPATIHLALDDASGDSAVLELIDGRIKVYHNRKHTVMTNQPQFDEQLKNLRQYKGFGGNKKLPGTHTPSDRLVRGAFYVTHLRKPHTERQAVAALMSVMRNVSVPIGFVNDPDQPHASNTLWRSVEDLTHGLFYFDDVLSPRVLKVKLHELNFDADQQVQELEVEGNYDLRGNVSKQFHQAKMFKFLPPEKTAS